MENHDSRTLVEEWGMLRLHLGEDYSPDDAKVWMCTINL